MHPTDRSGGTSIPTHLPRRTLVAAGAWTVPVVAAATAAPAYAASPCQKTYSYKLQWRTASYTHDQAGSTSTSLTTSGGFTTVAPLTVGGATIYVVLESSRQGNTTFDSNRNLSIPGGTVGAGGSDRDPAINNLAGLNTTLGEDTADSPQRGLRLQNWRSGPTGRTTPSTRANRQTMTVSFRTGGRAGDLRMVKNLTFWITDLDSLSGSGAGTSASPYVNTPTRYYDRVELTPAGQFTTLVKDGITGDGTDVSPWLNSNNNKNNGENNTGARVKVRFNSDVSSFTIDYWNAVGGEQYHRIFLSNLKFDVFGC